MRYFRGTGNTKCDIAMNSDKKKPRSLVRQNTFSLEASEATAGSKKLGRLSRLGILDRADTMCKLSPEVREYLAAHLTMMIEETDKLMIENDKLRTEISLGNSNSDKKLKTVKKQLEKERAKSKILMSRVKENPSAVGNEDVILIANSSNTDDSDQQLQLNLPLSREKKHKSKSSGSLRSSQTSEEVHLKKMSQELWSFNQSSEIEKSRLTELVRLLTGKLSTAEEAGSQSELKLREEIQRCARLELTLEKTQLGNSNCTPPLLHHNPPGLIIISYRFS